MPTAMLPMALNTENNPDVHPLGNKLAHPTQKYYLAMKTELTAGTHYIKDKSMKTKKKSSQKWRHLQKDSVDSTS